MGSRCGCPAGVGRRRDPGGAAQGACRGRRDRHAHPRFESDRRADPHRRRGARRDAGHHDAAGRRARDRIAQRQRRVAIDLGRRAGRHAGLSVHRDRSQPADDGPLERAHESDRRARDRRWRREGHFAGDARRCDAGRAHRRRLDARRGLGQAERDGRGRHDGVIACAARCGRRRASVRLCRRLRARRAAALRERTAARQQSVRTRDGRGRQPSARHRQQGAGLPRQSHRAGHAEQSRGHPRQAAHGIDGRERRALGQRVSRRRRRRRDAPRQSSSDDRFP